MATGDVFRLTAIWQRGVNPHIAVNQFHYRQESDTIMDTDIEDLMSRFLYYVKDPYLDCVTDYLSLMTVRVSRSPDFYTEWEQPILEAGTRTGEPLPPFTSGRIAVKTADYSRKGRSQIYLPPATEGENTNGNPSASYTAILDAFKEAVSTNMAGLSLAYAQYTYGMWSPTDAAFKAATAMLVKSGWSHQVDRRSIY